MPSRVTSRPAPPLLRTVPVLAVLVCHDGEPWLGEALSALRRLTPRPRHVVAVDTGSTDATPRLLAEAADNVDRVLDGVLTLDRHTGFGDAVRAAVAHAVQRWGDPGGWIWLLHDDCAPEQDCLGVLLTAAEISPSVGVLGPLALEWTDPRLVVEAGVSTDAAGHRQTGIGPDELDWGRLGGSGSHRFEQSTEVLAVSSAGLLVRRPLWERLDGFDAGLPLLFDDVDFGWRANRAGTVALCVPAARIRHARALFHGERVPDALGGREGADPELLVRTAERANGLRTFLVNCSLLSFLLGLPRLAVLCLVRALAMTVSRRIRDARAELVALGRVFTGLRGIVAARAARRAGTGSGSVHGLLTSRFTRVRNAVRGGVAHLIRRRVAADAALGKLADSGPGAAVLVPPAVDAAEIRRPIGPDALPAGALGRTGLRRDAGLRRPPRAVAVSLTATDAVLPPGLRPSPRPRPSPFPRGAGSAQPQDLLLVQFDRQRVFRQILLAPPLVLVLAMAVIGLVVNWHRLGVDLAGGRLLPAADLARTWSQYVAGWHPVAGGTAAAAPPALAVLGVLGGVLAPVGGVPAAVAVLLLGDLPLAALSAYVATRRLAVSRRVRAVVAACYAMLPPATAAVAQGRLDAVVVHILLPLVFSGMAAVMVRGSRSWLPTAAGSAVGLAVIGAFSPLVHLMVLVCALAGFVLVPGSRANGGRAEGALRRAGALLVMVLFPVALLVPWPATLIKHPGLVVHGLGAWLPEQSVSALGLVSLEPGGAGAWPGLGLLVPLAALVAVALRPTRAALPGFGLALLGAVAVALLQAMPAVGVGGGPAQRGWPGAALIVVGWGLLLVFVTTCRPAGSRPVAYRLLAGLAVAAVAALAVGATVPGRAGPLRDGGGARLAPTLARELADTGRSVLILSFDGEPVRQSTGRMPSFGDDDLAPVPSAAARLNRLDADLRDDRAEVVRAAVASAAVTGVLFVVPPDRATGERILRLAADVVIDAPPTTDGRPVVRLRPVAGRAALLAPELARRAVTGGDPPTDLAVGGVVPVDAAPPNVAVRVSDGADGRLLVVAAAEEPGWRAEVDGRAVPVVRAWDGLVGVAVPPSAADVRVEYSSGARGPLLLIQAAMVLFALLTAIPGRRERVSP